MKAYGVNELREMFLSFFESKDHLRLPSFSLVPQNDKSILLINAGMTPMAFNDGIYFNNNTSSGTFDTDIVICYWSNGWDS